MNSQPGDQEIEVSLFGPGYGEGILVHLGKKEWIIVDSCINPKSRKAAALEYLEKINVNLNLVKLVVATHWHDDHIRGLSNIVKACNKADFVISDALRQDEFIKLLSLYSGTQMMKSSSGLSEMSEIFNYLSSKKRIPRRAIADRPLISKKKDASGLEYQVTSLSPSDASILLSNLQIAELIPQFKKEIKRLPFFTPNSASVALWISINKKNFLLGSDLESTKDENTGWAAILNSDTKPSGKADLFKVPHHGSANADSQSVWNEIVVNKPVVILSPFKRGNITLPKPSDIKRLCKKTENCFITADSKNPTPEGPALI